MNRSSGAVSLFDVVMVSFLIFILATFWAYFSGRLNYELVNLSLSALTIFIFLLMVAIYYEQAKIMNRQAIASSEQTKLMKLQADIMNLQTEILRRQSKILELEKKPMLYFQVKSIDHGRMICKFKIQNLSKYPVIIKEAIFEQEQGDTNLKGKRILPGSEIHSKMSLLGTVKLKVSNLYYNSTLEYEYSPKDEKITIKENSEF